jgi:hypothetical protein
MTRRTRCFLSFAAGAALFLLHPGTGDAHPEFQRWIQQHSGRSVDCALCHAHPDGPEGTRAGQIGSLDADELQRLFRARGAFAPGQDVDSPILNAFGNHIIRTLGKKRFLELRTHPEELPDALGFTSDMDHDGVPDARELQQGTHPLNPRSGSPGRLFLRNLRRFAFQETMIFLATAFGLFGLNHLLRGLTAPGGIEQRGGRVR